jgi:hypothetical protein
VAPPEQMHSDASYEAGVFQKQCLAVSSNVSGATPGTRIGRYRLCSHTDADFAAPECYRTFLPHPHQRGHRPVGNIIRCSSNTSVSLGNPIDDIFTFPHHYQNLLYEFRTDIAKSSGNGRVGHTAC